MAEEAVIFPDRPLFMVDRGWQRLQKRAGKISAQAIHERELVLQPSRVPEVTITVAKEPNSTRSTSSPESKNGRTKTKGNQKKSASVQFMNYEPPKAKKKSQYAAKDLARSRRPVTEPLPSSAALMERDDIRNTSFVFKQALPGTATAFYSIIDPEVSSFQDYVSYYPTRLAVSMYPIGKAVPLTHNPIETIWFPAILKDEVSLHTILFSCAMHHFLTFGQSTFKDSDLLMKVILSRLNRRINDGKYSDLTIGAVSCLALCENHLGNHKKSRMHAAGMSEMVRERGGFQNVRDVLHMKIYRADTIGAVDTLTHPNFPRPVRVMKSLFSTLALEPQSSPVKALLVDLGLTKTVLEALVELSLLCQALNYAAENFVAIDPLAFDEDVTCIQHDLLRSLGPKQAGVEQLCAITALIFVQTLTREVPFTRLSSSQISRQLKEAFPALDAAKAPAPLIYWMLFMGGLVSMNTDERHWFRKRLRDFQQLRDDLVNWDNAEAQLQKVFWVEAVQDTLGLVLWHDINTAND